MWLLLLWYTPFLLCGVCSTLGCEQDAVIQPLCFHTSNHRGNQLANDISTSTFTDVLRSPCLSGQQCGKVIKVKLSAKQEVKDIISLCLLNVLAVVAPPLAVQLAQIRQPAACRDVAVGGVNVLTSQWVYWDLEIFSLRLLVHHSSWGSPRSR